MEYGTIQNCTVIDRQYIILVDRIVLEVSRDCSGVLPDTDVVSRLQQERRYSRTLLGPLVSFPKVSQYQTALREKRCKASSIWNLWYSASSVI